MSHDAESAHCMSSSTMTSGRSTGGEAEVLGDLLEQHVLAARRAARACRRPPSAGTRCGSSRHVALRRRVEPPDGADDLRPRGVRRLDVGLVAAADDERAGAQAHLGLELLACSVDLPTPASPLIATTRGGPSAASSSSLTSARSSVLRPTNRSMRSGRCAGSAPCRVASADAVAPLPLDHVERAVGGGEQRLGVVAVHRGRWRRRSRPSPARARRGRAAGTRARAPRRRCARRPRARPRRACWAAARRTRRRRSARRRRTPRRLRAEDLGDLARARRRPAGGRRCR